MVASPSHTPALGFGNSAIVKTQESLSRPLLSGHYHNIHGLALGLHSQRNTTGRTHRSQSTSIGKYSVDPKLHCWLRWYSVAVAPLHHPSLGNWTSRSTMPLQFQSASSHIHTTFITLEQVHMDVLGTPGVWCRHSLLHSPQPTHGTIHSACRHYQSPADSNSGQNPDIRALLTIRHGDSRFGDHGNNCQFYVAEDYTCRSLSSLSSPQVTIRATQSQSYPRLGDKFALGFAIAIIPPASWSRLVPRGGFSPFVVPVAELSGTQ